MYFFGTFKADYYTLLHSTYCDKTTVKNDSGSLKSAVAKAFHFDAQTNHGWDKFIANLPLQIIFSLNQVRVKIQ